jgi:hypothetical protein
MKPIYMTHEVYGVHIAYSQDEIDRNVGNGWKVYGDTPPGAATRPVVMEEAKAKRKYTRRAA